MRSIDTNVLVRLIAQDDERQAAAAGIFIEKGAWVSILSLAEAIWVLGTVYALSQKALSTAIEMLLNHKHLVVQDADAVASALNLFIAKPSLSFSDCLILQVARKFGHSPLGTFDRDLAKVEGTRKL